MNEGKIQQIIGGAAAENRTTLSEIESKQILEALGIATAMPYAARSGAEAATAAARCGFPVVLKVLSPDVTHKSDVGGVALGLGSEKEVREAYDRIRANLATHVPNARFEGVAVQAMARPGVEMLAGIARDPQFGPMILAGMGGILVEVMKDTAVRIAPVSQAEARAMVAELRGAAMLNGVRGAAPSDHGAFAALLASLSEFAARHPEIKEMDLNPVVVYPSGLCVLDARVMLDRAERNGHDAELCARRLKNLDRAIKPRTVAVIGDRGQREYMWMRAQANFTGKLYSVQPDPREFEGIAKLGIPNFKSMSEVPEPVDYAIVAVPRQSANQVLADCIKAKTAGVGFFTAGFSEVGDELGVKLESEMRELAAGADIALVGPNCMGLCNPGLGLFNSPSLSRAPVRGGDVCFISQSGTHAISFVMKAPGRGIKINLAASIGNATILEPPDYIDVMANDPATRAIGMYVEGVKDGRRFFDSLRRAAARHPVLVWKGGVTESGARATFSHTGSLATPAAVWKAAMRQSGAAEVINLEAMLDAMELLTRTREVRGRRMALVAMTGGQSVVISDAFARHGLEVPALSQSTYEQFSTFFKVIGGSYKNPLDAAWTMGHAGQQGNTDRVLDILEQDPVIDAIVMELRPGPGFGVHREVTEEDLKPMIDLLAGFDQRSKKPFAVVIDSGHIPPESETWIVSKSEELARARGLVTFIGFERAAAAFRAAAESYENRARLSS